MTPEEQPSSCPVERLLRRLTCAPPADGAERVLTRLTPERVSCELYWGEVGRIARRAVLASAALAVAGLGLLAVVAHRRPPGPPAPPPAAPALELADARRVSAELALPFPSRGGK